MTVEWETLYHFVRRAFDRGLLEAIEELGMYDEADLARPGFRSVISLGILKGNDQYPEQNKQESYTMAFLLKPIRQRIARNAVDKVYGALAIMPSDLRQSLIVNVKMTQAQVYAGFTRCLFEGGDTSLTLSHVSHSMKVEGLPSWCPDFAEVPIAFPFNTVDLPTAFAD